MKKNRICSGIELIKRIDEILSEKGISRKEFAKELNIQPNTMGNWKTNNSMPPADTIVRIADALNVSIDWLLTGKEFHYVNNQIDFNEEQKFIINRLESIRDNVNLDVDLLLSQLLRYANKKPSETFRSKI